jgi:membrane protein
MDLSARTHRLSDLLKKTYTEWQKDRAPQLGAALAFYVMFSLAPLLVLIFTILSVFYQQQAIQGEVVTQLGNIIGTDNARTVQDLILVSNEHQATSIWAAILSILSLLLTASGGFAQLKDSLNQIWKVDFPEISGLRGGALEFARNNVLMFFMVLSTGLLVGLSTVINITLTAVNNFVGSYIQNAGTVVLFQIINFLISLCVITVLFALIYKVVPDIVLSWKDVGIGAIFTALFFSIGRVLLSYYIAINSTSSTYAAAGAIFVLLLWTYYSGLIFYFGAEFTKVYAYTYGSKAYLNEYLNKDMQGENVKKGLSILLVTGIISFIGGAATLLSLKRKFESEDDSEQDQ